MTIRETARSLRLQGKTYSDISNELNVAKSTLFYWLSDIKNPNGFSRTEHLHKIRKLASDANKTARLNRIKSVEEKVKKEISTLNLKDKQYLRSLAAMLYWAEGSKGRGGVVFANTDPTLAKFFITLLRSVFEIDESKLRVRIHLHSYHDVEVSKVFWSNLLGVPLNQFGKIYIKQRSESRKYRQNFAGICFIKYHSESLKTELLSIGREIAFNFVPVA